MCELVLNNKREIKLQNQKHVSVSFALCKKGRFIKDEICIVK